MVQTPGVFLELVNLPDDASKDWSEWYDATILKARTKIPGVVGGRRCKGVVGSIQNLVVYDLANFYTPYSNEWQEIDAQFSSEAPASSRAPLPGSESLVYRQIFSMFDEPYEPPDTEILHGAFFEVESANQGEFNDWYNTEHIEFVKTVEGYLNCRRFQSLEIPTKFIALYDVVARANSEAKNVHPQNYTPWAKRVRAKLPTYTERRLFQVEQREQGQR